MTAVSSLLVLAGYKKTAMKLSNLYLSNWRLIPWKDCEVCAYKLCSVILLQELKAIMAPLPTDMNHQIYRQI